MPARKVVLIENEFGEIGIDGGFLQEAGIQITEMNSGCICCSLVGDFGKALQKVMEEYHPDRILIEPSGVGKLSDVAPGSAERAETDDMETGWHALPWPTRTKCQHLYEELRRILHNDQIANCREPLFSASTSQYESEDKLDRPQWRMLRENNATRSDRHHSLGSARPAARADGAPMEQKDSLRG